MSLMLMCKKKIHADSLQRASNNLCLLSEECSLSFQRLFFFMSTVILVFPCILFLLQGSSVSKRW